MAQDVHNKLVDYVPPTGGGAATTLLLCDSPPGQPKKPLWTTFLSSLAIKARSWRHAMVDYAKLTSRPAEEIDFQQALLMNRAATGGGWSSSTSWLHGAMRPEQYGRLSRRLKGRIRSICSCFGWISIRSRRLPMNTESKPFQLSF